MNILLIDDDEIILGFARACLEQEIPDAEITDYPTLTLGRPGPDFDWARFDVLLLDYNLGNGETGVGWLDEFGQLPGFPITILLTAVTDPLVVGQAVASGANAYLNKANLSPEQLAAAVHDVLGPGLYEPTIMLPEDERGSMTSGADSATHLGETDPMLDTAAEQFDAGGGYRMRRRIGQGAMSAVYIAERVQDGQTVAIKVLEHELADDPALVQRFVLEAEIVTEIDSPYVVRVLEQGFTHRYGFIAMEFFGRGDLKQQIALGIDDATTALAYLYDILSGLEVIHDTGIVHRDLKPANIMFRSDGTLALVDFGIAKSLASDLSLTATGSLLGTPHYMSPEVAAGDDADPRSDLYAAGIIFYEMLTGMRPYEGSSLTALVFQQIYAAPPTLPAHLANFQPLIDGMMAKNPEERAQSARAVLDAIARAGYRRR